MNLTAGQRATAYVKTGGRCAYCGCELNKNYYHVDHIVPKSLGGKSNRYNLIAACPECNLFKADLTVEEFRRKIGALVVGAIPKGESRKNKFKREIIAKYYGAKNEPVKFFFEEIDNGYI